MDVVVIVVVMMRGTSTAVDGANAGDRQTNSGSGCRVVSGIIGVACVAKGIIIVIVRAPLLFVGADAKNDGGCV